MVTRLVAGSTWYELAANGGGPFDLFRSRKASPDVAT
jgi:hypothetical protein